MEVIQFFSRVSSYLHKKSTKIHGNIVTTGVEIIEMLRGHTSGFAVPTFVVDAPGGGGKIPVNPQYLISQSPEKVILRNFEGVVCTYTDPQDKTHNCKRSGGFFTPGIDKDIAIRDATEKDIPQMTTLFSEVFKTYPSPVFDTDYLKNVMQGKTLFKVAVQDGKIISIASAEMDFLNLNAEMTDCATYPEYRGKGLLTNLMYHLENDLRNKGFIALYSLCRAIEPGINKALHKLDYKYTGRLVNNCNICGGFEDMNIWVKVLER